MAKLKNKKIKVSVKKKHIVDGQPEDADCAIALAVQDKGFVNVSVDNEFIAGFKNGVYYRAVTPKKAATFIEKYDSSSFDEETNEYTFTVKPISFDLILTPIE